MVDPNLMKIIVCPICTDHPSLEVDGDALLCTRCWHKFPVKNGIINLLVKERNREE
jgi:uncharacterized protein YbaR (Trm112 family)